MDVTRRRFLGAVAAMPLVTGRLIQLTDDPNNDEEQETSSSSTSETSTSFISCTSRSTSGYERCFNY